LTNKVNAAILANEPSSRVVFNEKGIATAIEISAVNNRATAEISKRSGA
jgi:hypothetical protein